MNKLFLLLCLITLSSHVVAQDILGKWETYDDKTGAKKSVVEIFKKDDKYFGKIVERFSKDKDKVCTECEGDKKNKPLTGLVIIENLEKDDGKFIDGTITDPETGDVYDLNMELIEKNKLKVRGYIGFSLLGRTQYWLRKE